MWLYRLQPARLNRAFRMSGQCRSDLHQCLIKLRWKFPPEISRYTPGVSAECVLRLKEIRAETNYCAYIWLCRQGVPKYREDIVKFHSFGCLAGRVVSRHLAKTTVYPSLCFPGKASLARSAKWTGQNLWHSQQRHCDGNKFWILGVSLFALFHVSIRHTVFMEGHSCLLFYAEQY